MLIASNISKTYVIKERKGFLKKSAKVIQAVNNVNLKLEEGKIIGLLGVNGAGKTTTIKMLTGIIDPSAGTITIDDTDVTKDSIKVKKIINMITGGERNIYWRLTARENLEYFGALYGINKKELADVINKSLDVVGLTEVQDIPVERYSKGMKQRLQIARGLINNPKYLFLDEPTLGLDISIAKELRGYIKKLAQVQGKGILITTHYILEAEELCDYIYLIDKGSIIAQGAPNELKKQFKNNDEYAYSISKLNSVAEKKLLKLLSDMKMEYAIEEKDGMSLLKIYSGKAHKNEIMKFLEDNKICLFEMKMVEPSLEEVLLTLISGGGQFERDNISDTRRDNETAS